MTGMRFPSILALPPLAALLFTPDLKADATLDQILAELRALNEKVSRLEERIAELEAAPAPASPQTMVSPETTEPEKEGFFDRFRIEMHKADMRAIGGWTDPENWKLIRPGMTEEKVVDLLGEPTARKFSIRKDTDAILHYRGDLDGQGALIEGAVRIYKGEVARVEPPDFPESN